MNDIENKYKQMLTIRLFEEKLLELFSANRLSGTTHTCIGQEAVAVASMSQVHDGDIVFSNHRCHGHYLAYGGPPEKLFAEIMSRKSGLCQGRGGSQHIKYKNFYSNGVQGGVVPNAVGMAWAEKINATGNIAVVFIGDGTLGQGIIYEAFNMASLYEIPVLFIIENNQYAMSTPVHEAVAGSIRGRCEAFGIECDIIKSNDVELLEEKFIDAYKYVRNEKKPFCQIVETYRLAAHSKGDDTRDPEEIKEHEKSDPLKIAEEKVSRQFAEETRREITGQIEQILNRLEDEEVQEVTAFPNEHVYNKKMSVFNEEEMFCVKAINAALDEAMEENEDIMLLGEDIRDPYGGAFKVTKGLSGKYPDRVINTPISEAGFTGVGVGLALNGKIPVIEMMFGDFLTLSMDQILNHATKYAWVYGDGVKVPLVMRAPMGSGRGYGPTHSQSLEKHFIGIPFLNIMAFSPVVNVKNLYKSALSNIDNPLVIIENKKTYSEKLLICDNNKIDSFSVSYVWNDLFPSIKMSLDTDTKADVTIIAYGGTVKNMMDAATSLMLEDEIQADIVVVSQLSPIPLDDLKELINGAGVIGIIEEGGLCGGWGAEVIAVLHEHRIGNKYFRAASENVPIPNGVLLENQVLLNNDMIVRKIKENL